MVSILMWRVVLRRVGIYKKKKEGGKNSQRIKAANQKCYAGEYAGLGHVVLF